MKIGIITLPLHFNYGGILQAYALQTILERMGNDVVIIEQQKKKSPSLRLFFAYIKRFICKYILGKQIRIFAEKYDSYAFPIITTNTMSFINKYIHIIKVEDYGMIKSQNFDAIVVGSDQIWRPKYFHCIENAFLNFAMGWNIKRIAYAASFGTSVWEYSDTQTHNCQTLVKLFDLISVRESFGCDLCRKYLNVEASHVLDPTMLLTRKDYESLISDYNEEINGNMMVYLLDETPSNMEAVFNIAKNLKLTPFKANSKVEDFFAPINERIQPPLEKWLKGFKESDLVITDSFHACVFSIIFHKDFYAICNPKRGNDRFISLLEMFGLTDRLFNSLDEINVLKLKSIDYESVERKLKEKRQMSLSLLRTSLTMDNDSNNR